MDPSPDDAAFTRPTRSFPGGQVRLPKLQDLQRGTGPRIDVVGTAFVGGGTTVIEEATPTGFTGYYTYESLFEEPAEGDEGHEEDPYSVLGVEPTQDWATIVAAHRSLVKEFHPDRFVDHPADVVAQAEVEIKRINRAYSELRKVHADEERERRSGKDRRA